MLKRSFLLLFGLVVLLLPYACNKNNDGEILPGNTLPTENKPENFQHYKVPYAANAYWNQKIGDNPEIDANSALLVQTLVDEEADQRFIFGTKKWTMPVYYADAKTKRYDVELTASWSPHKKLKDVPIPDFASPDSESDGHMVIIDEANGCEYDLWQARKKGSKWKAGWANAIQLDSDGIYENGLSCRGSGFGLLAGLIWPEELHQDKIEHKLVFSISNVKSGGPVPPATESDGVSNKNGSIPEGALFQLNPDLDLETLGLTDYEKTIARALQEYGMVCADDGGGIFLYGVHANSAKNNPYDPILPQTTDYTYLDNIPVDQFRLIKMGAQDPNVDAGVVSNGCNGYD